MLDDAYNARMLALAADIPRLGPLTSDAAGAYGTATRHARLCGSRLSAELRLADGRVADHAQEVEACALGRASASIVARNAIGADAAELRAARDAARMVLETGEAPDLSGLPDGKWTDIALLAVLKDFRARHGSVMLAFEAALEACEAALAAHAPA